MLKKIKAVHTVKLLVEAQLDKPSAAIASNLSPKKVKPIDFCNLIKSRTMHLKKGTPLSVIVYIDAKGDFEVDIKSPATSYLLKEAAGVLKGVAQAKKLPEVGTITRAQLTEIAKIKLRDLSTDDLEKAIKIVYGSAVSMGIKVTG